ncbi:hypothetical protein KBX35_11335 [Micromonospora sp. C32]|uniref:hypothetical protein n=1 Tax=unclassified Micromonospora TaxID=2617518 RepID=UPI001B38FE4C|nr:MULTISPECIES: hypothetical protein [unclassified Micromonospora]MBQ1045476.1 hypothetical protein [Micromonospora sp. C72]MBQ1055375.1 hypothetical protein [Micromonospora sp. C32]
MASQARGVGVLHRWASWGSLMQHELAINAGWCSGPAELASKQGLMRRGGGQRG